MKRLPLRDPRTVARDIPGVLDILFPRLSGALVASLNRTAFSFEGLEPVSNELIGESKLQKAMLFELAVVRAEFLLSGQEEPDWALCIEKALRRQSRHYDAKQNIEVTEVEIAAAEHASENLVRMIESVQLQNPDYELEVSPKIPGLGWISSGTGDFSLGSMLVEVKHTNRNFISGDFRQVLMYWLLKYASAIEHDALVWRECLLLNPRRNSALHFNFDTLLVSASDSSNRVELCELLRSIVEYRAERR